jgi:ribosomal protein S18 acetylase RimI-like enzyme
MSKTNYPVIHYFSTKIKKDNYYVNIILATSNDRNQDLISLENINLKNYIGDVYKSVVGSIRYIINGDTIFITGIDVLEKYRRKSIASNLIKLLIEHFNKLDLDKIKVDCIETNRKKENNLFCKLGFKFLNEGEPGMIYSKNKSSNEVIYLSGKSSNEVIYSSNEFANPPNSLRFNN